MTKFREREAACQLRHNGKSLNEICQQLNVSKSTVSRWVREIALTEEQMARLMDRRDNKADREKFSQTMRYKREARHDALRQAAEAQYVERIANPLFVFGLALYAGEGSKTTPGKIALVNCDWRIVRRSVQFYELIGIPINRVRVRLQLHPGIDEEPVLAYWQQHLELPASQFLPVCRKVSRASLDRAGHKQPNGICEVYACSVVLWNKLLHWMAMALDPHQPLGSA